VDKHNRLVYEFNEPSALRKQYGLKKKIIFSGNWCLNRNHDLEYILNQARQQQSGERLTFKGELISADNDNFVFELISRQKRPGPALRGASTTYSLSLLGLSGRWQADEFNRLRFNVKKKALPDTLTLEGAWQVNKNQEIVYTYEKVFLKRKIKSTHSLLFRGYWQFNQANRLTYILNQSSDSRFDFRVYLESPSLLPKQGQIRYRLGIGLRPAKAALNRVITLYGAWKFNRQLGLDFQMDYGSGRVRSLEFIAKVCLTSKDEITFALLNKFKEPLALNITFTHKFLKRQGPEILLRLKRSYPEDLVEAGMRIPF
jgi:hypothetical protein